MGKTAGILEDMSEPLHPGVFADIKQMVAELKIPADATQNEKILHATVKGDMALLVAEIERLQGEVAAEREACARLSENPYSDSVQAYGQDEPLAVGSKIAAAIRARGEKK